MPRVFLSYARADGEERAAELRARLAGEADIEVRQDRLFLEGGTGWWKQITDAIDAVEFLILLMTPAATASGNVEKEWRYARQVGVCVYPVKGADLEFGKMPRWMGKAHFFDLEKEWPTLLGHLRKGCERRRVPFMAPELPAHFVPRPAEFGALKKLLLGQERAVAITTALSGAGGFGKTTLAAALCRDADVVEYFDDGILWVTLGQTPALLGALVTVYAALTGERPGFSSAEDAAFQLGQKLEQRNCLLVIDDVWDAAHLRPFLRGGASSSRLFTTRDASIAAEAAAVDVDQMRTDEAEAMLLKAVPSLGSGEARVLAGKLGEWPLALELAAAMMKERVRRGEPAAKAAERLDAILERKGVRALQDTTAELRHRTISDVMQASLELLSDADRRRLAELSMFPEDVKIPLAAAGAVWELDEFDAEDRAQRLARLTLVKLDLQRGVMEMHDVMRSWLADGLADSGALHERLVSSWPDWNHLPDDYAWRWLPWHLVGAGRRADLERILWDPVWMQAKLRAAHVNVLIADYEHLKPSAEADLVQGALRLSSNVLAVNAEQFAPQMTGRLLPHQALLPIARLMAAIGASAPERWLRPLFPGLHPSGTGLLRTLEGHSAPVSGVAVTADGKRAISASDDNTLKVWDLGCGVLRTLADHSSFVSGVAVTVDGKRAVSASYDKTLKVWDLESGDVLRTLVGHSDSVSGVAVTADGKRAVSASRDKTLKVWDLESGDLLRTLEGHSDSVEGVAVTADGKGVVSASRDHTLKLWDLESGDVLRTLEGHTSFVYGVAVTADGKRAVSASWDHTLKVWDLKSGGVLRTLEGHSDSVSAVAVTADGKRAISASGDHTLKVWDLESGGVLRTLEGHSDFVSGVAVTADGKRAVSASGDKTLKMWDLESGSGLRPRKRHASSVSGVAVTADGKRAVSASWDHTLKVWDLESGSVLRTLKRHSDSVNGVAVTADGKQAISASGDKTLKVWDLESGAVLRTLEGHSDSVNGVAVTTGGTWAVSTSWDHTLKVWDLETGGGVRTLEGHSAPVYGVAVTADGRRAVSASWDNTLKVWDLESGAVLSTLKGHSNYVYGVAVTADGKQAVSASGDNTLKVWDLESGSVLRTLEGHSDFVSGVAVTADGKWAVSASWDKTLRVWDLESGSPLATFFCDAPARCCAFAGERTVVAGDRVGQLHVLLLEGPRLNPI